ncbi:MAG TPA: hypothetical protein VIM41_07085 [Gammaproteobacteria bacterium]
MESQQWYQVFEGTELSQGDIIRDCPIPRIVNFSSYPIEENDEVDLEFVETDVIVLSQSCDLANSKINDVIVAEVIEWEKARDQMVKSGNQLAKSKDFRKSLVAGNIPSLSLLRKHEGEPKLDWSVIDFHNLSVVPKSVLNKNVANTGSRLTLMSPYKEHVAQAFARYFMRVGLPHDAKEFETEGA